MWDDSLENHLMLTQNDAVVVIVDVQNKLTAVIHNRDLLVANLTKLVRGARALALPIIWVEQVPDRMGPTIPELRELLTGLTPISKKTFSCAGEPGFMKALQATGRRTVLLAGIETHVCIAQTATDLAAAGYNVNVVADAVSSRTPENRQIGLDLVRQGGGLITGVESLLFQLLVSADHPAFREILRIVK